jgi:hypothetical protein
MKTLIPLVKSDRLREIVSYKSKGYIFRVREDKYTYIRKITINLKGKTYSFELRDNQADTRFYICLEDSCIYLTLPELYEILREITKKLGYKRVCNILTSERNKIGSINYMGLEFEVDFFSKPIPKGTILLPESNLEISYEYLFLLISLIQDKSNYLWVLSSEDNRKYVDGILRLFVCLLSSKDNKVLEKLGWFYDATANGYIFDELKKVNDPIVTKDVNDKEIRIKYYLTEEQFKDIIKMRNPSNFVNDGGILR